MLELISNFSGVLDIIVILIAIAVCFFCKYLLPAYATRIIENKFNKELAKHKHSLELLTESAKFDYQRRLADINQFVIMKHDHYKNLYGDLLFASGYVAQMRCVVRQYDSGDSWNEQDFIELLDKITTSQGKRQSLIDLWHSSRKSALEEARSLEFHKEEVDTYNAIRKAHNQSLYAQIYLTDELSNDEDIIISKLWQLYYNAKKLRNHPEVIDDIDKFIRKDNQLNGEITLLLQKAVRAMRMELSGGGEMSQLEK